MVWQLARPLPVAENMTRRLSGPDGGLILKTVVYSGRSVIHRYDGIPIQGVGRVHTNSFMLLFAWLFFLTPGCGSNSESSDVSPNNARADAQVARERPTAVEHSDEPRMPHVNQPSLVPSDRETEIASVERRLEQGDLAGAEAKLRTLLVRDPADAEVIFRLATVRARDGDLVAAVELLDTIPTDHPDAGLPALGQAADWYFELNRYRQAENRYLQILQLAPEASEAHRKLAYLYNRQGRRHEAAAHIYQLCRQGNVRQDELHALIVLSDAMVSEPGDDVAVDYSPIGASGLARKLFSEQRYVDAVDALRETVAAGDAPPSVVAFYGRIVAEAQDDQEFFRWFGKTDASVREFSEYWSALAVHLLNRRQYEAATRASLEALDRDPTDFRSIGRLHLTLRLMGKDDESSRWEQRWWTYKRVLNANNAISDAQVPNVEAMAEIAAQLNSIDRKLEAVLWKSVESYYRQVPPDTMNQWNLQRQHLVASGTGYPDRSSRLCGMSPDAFRMPDLHRWENSETPLPERQQQIEQETSRASFANLAGKIGLTHRFRPAPEDIESGFRMYQQAGGGVAVLDYDLDGNPDLYFAQGAADPPGFVANQSNVLYRSSAGLLNDVTVQAGATDFQYTIGTTSGDWNQDGFPDLVTTNIGASYLWINNGDGTFSAKRLPGTDDLERMPTSIAMADLNGDAIPDLFELNYLQDANITSFPPRNETGSVAYAAGPADYTPAVDRIGINDCAGGVNFEPISDNHADSHHGFGVVIADFDGKLGNEVFVGNDKSANQMWVRDQISNRWTDVALINGTAFSYGGVETASMGIASGDFDRNGTLDLHITNFQNESACLYLGRDELYQDRAIAYRLGVPSRSVLGFGTQTLDYDNNGSSDLIVTNGHVDDYETMSGDFRQLPQLFCNRGSRFDLSPVDDASGYWTKGHLGRALARIDFNRDGRNDVVVTHIGEPSALLLNQTATDNHWLQVQLVGVQSERDAVGARIKISAGYLELTDWVVAGDGYLCRNEQVVSFGLGDATVVDRIEIAWPSGETQTIEQVPANRRILVVENDSSAFTLPAVE